MTKTACIHWEFISSFLPGSSTFPTSQNVIKLLDIMSLKLFVNHSIHTWFYKHLPFVLQHNSSFFYFMCLFYGFIIWVFIYISNLFITKLRCCISRLFSTSKSSLLHLHIKDSGSTDLTRVVTANTMFSAVHTLPGLLMLAPCYGSTDLTTVVTANTMFSVFQPLHYVQYVT